MQTVDVSSILFLSSFSDSGIGIESGVFVASLAPGSPAARECSLAVGDRLLAVSMPTKIFWLFVIIDQKGLHIPCDVIR